MKNLVLLVWLSAASPLITSAIEVTGYVSSEIRVFEESPLDPNQNGGASLSFSIEPEFFHSWDNGDWSAEFKPFFRYDSDDDNRTHADIRELYVHRSSDNWELKVGLSKLFWGVTESQHLVDVINQTDLVQSFDQEEKLGQQMVQLSLILNWGYLDFFVLPGFRERTFPDAEGRLRTTPRVDTDRPIYESSAEEWHFDYAVRYSNYFGPVDLGVYYFYGTSRDPQFRPDVTPSGETVLRPFYGLMHQFGTDIQYTIGSWLWKLEAIARSGDGQHYQAFIGGYEYTFYGILDRAWDLGVLTEYHYDTRGSDAPTPFNRDVFAGLRLALNDEFDSSLLAGAFYDHDNDTSTYRIEYERRIGQSLKLNVELQKFGATDSLDPAYSLRSDSYLSVELQRYF